MLSALRVPVLRQAARAVPSARSFASSSSARKHLLDLEQEGFETTILKGDKGQTFIVDFYADWCGPCKFLTPILKKAVPESSEKLHLATVNTDNEQTLAMGYKISALPTVVAIREGKEIGRFVGAKQPQGVQEFLDSL